MSARRTAMPVSPDSQIFLRFVQPSDTHLVLDDSERLPEQCAPEQLHNVINGRLQQIPVCSPGISGILTRGFPKKQRPCAAPIRCLVLTTVLLLSALQINSILRITQQEHPLAKPITSFQKKSELHSCSSVVTILAWRTANFRPIRVFLPGEVFMQRNCVRILLSLAASVVIAMPLQAGVIFNLIDTGGAGIGTQARTGFQQAADFYSSLFSDDVTINLEIGFKSLPAGVLGSASSSIGQIAYAGFAAAVAADITSANDAVFSANLPSGSDFSIYINGTSDNPNGSGSSTPYVDDNAGANNSIVTMNFANAKALGLLAPDDAAVDAAITFSSDFSWDFDSSNGITGGTYDFVAVATHEIGHALGFTSGVDILDINTLPADGGPFPADAFFYVKPLDFTRFSSDSETAGADIDWTADTRAKYFSIDGGSTVYLANAFSTGKNLGDGQQASHWKDSLGIGLMDPTLAAGELGTFSALDTLALDVIGWDLITAVPEPSSVLLLSVATLFGFSRLRRRSQTDSVV